MTFILVLILTYLLGVCFFRFFLPLLLTFWARRISSKMSQGTGFSRQHARQASHREGRVTLDQTAGAPSSKSKVFKKEDGEYVDFEEIK